MDLHQILADRSLIRDTLACFNNNDNAEPTYGSDFRDNERENSPEDHYDQFNNRRRRSFELNEAWFKSSHRSERNRIEEFDQHEYFDNTVRHAQYNEEYSSSRGPSNTNDSAFDNYHHPSQQYDAPREADESTSLRSNLIQEINERLNALKSLEQPKKVQSNECSHEPLDSFQPNRTLLRYPSHSDANFPPEFPTSEYPLSSKRGHSPMRSRSRSPKRRRLLSSNYEDESFRNREQQIASMEEEFNNFRAVHHKDVSAVSQRRGYSSSFSQEYISASHHHSSPVQDFSSTSHDLEGNIVRKNCSREDDIIPIEPPKKPSSLRKKASVNVPTKKAVDESFTISLTKRSFNKIKNAEPADNKVIHYFDAGRYWCKSCNAVFDHLPMLTNHLHSSSHFETYDGSTRPWEGRIAKEKPIDPNITTDRLVAAPIKGLEFLFPVKGFYCTICNKFMGDALDSELHCKCKTHNSVYERFVDENPEYEEELEIERQRNLRAIRHPLSSTSNIEETMSNRWKRLTVQYQKELDEAIRAGRSVYSNFLPSFCYSASSNDANSSAYSVSSNVASVSNLQSTAGKAAYSGVMTTSYNQQGTVQYPAYQKNAMIGYPLYTVVSPYYQNVAGVYTRGHSTAQQSVVAGSQTMRTASTSHSQNPSHGKTIRTKQEKVEAQEKLANNSKKTRKTGRTLRQRANDSMWKAKEYMLNQDIDELILPDTVTYVTEKLQDMKIPVHMQKAFLCEVFVNSVPVNVLDQDIHARFSLFGPIDCLCRLQSKEMLFVKFETPHAADLCIREMRNATLADKRIQVLRPFRVSIAFPSFNEIIANAKDHNTLYVSAISKNATEADLYTRFKFYGKIKTCRLEYESSSTADHRGCALIEYQNRNAADRAILAMNLHYLKTQPIRVGKAIFTPLIDSVQNDIVPSPATALVVAAITTKKLSKVVPELMTKDILMRARSMVKNANLELEEVYDFLCQLPELPAPDEQTMLNNLRRAPTNLSVTSKSSSKQVIEEGNCDEASKNLKDVNTSTASVKKDSNETFKNSKGEKTTPASVNKDSNETSKNSKGEKTTPASFNKDSNETSKNSKGEKTTPASFNKDSNETSKNSKGEKTTPASVNKDSNETSKNSKGEKTTPASVNKDSNETSKNSNGEKTATASVNKTSSEVSKSSKDVKSDTVFVNKNSNGASSNPKDAKTPFKKNSKEYFPATENPKADVNKTSNGSSKACKDRKSCHSPSSKNSTETSKNNNDAKANPSSIKNLKDGKPNFSKIKKTSKESSPAPENAKTDVNKTSNESSKSFKDPTPCHSPSDKNSAEPSKNNNDANTNPNPIKDSSETPKAKDDSKPNFSIINEKRSSQLSCDESSPAKKTKDPIKPNSGSEEDWSSIEKRECQVLLVDFAKNNNQTSEKLNSEESATELPAELIDFIYGDSESVAD